MPSMSAEQKAPCAVSVPSTITLVMTTASATLIMLSPFASPGGNTQPGGGDGGGGDGGGEGGSGGDGGGNGGDGGGDGGGPIGMLSNPGHGCIRHIHYSLLVSLFPTSESHTSLPLTLSPPPQNGILKLCAAKEETEQQQAL